MMDQPRAVMTPVSQAQTREIAAPVARVTRTRATMVSASMPSRVPTMRARALVSSVWESFAVFVTRQADRSAERSR